MSVQRKRRGLAWLPAALVTMTWASSARADLTADTERLIAAWRRAPAEVRVAASAFLVKGETRRVELGLPLRRRHRCVAVVAVAERRVSFRLEALGRSQGSARATDSEAGAARVDDCGGGSLSTGKVSVTMGAPQAAVEILVAQYDARLPKVEDILIDRAAGPGAQPEEALVPWVLAPLEQRVLRADASARADGARTVVRVPARATDRGAGAILLKLTNGCHRLSVLSGDGPGGSASGAAAIDVDADVRLRGATDVLARDRSHAPDARLDFCLAETEDVQLSFGGAAAGAPVALLDGHWPLPESLPARWGKQALAGLAWGLHRRRAPHPVGTPVLEALGASGSTNVPFEVEARACYLALVGVTQGDAAGRLSVSTAAVIRHDEIGSGAAVSFCAPETSKFANAEVELAGERAAWVLVVWRLGAPP